MKNKKFFFLFFVKFPQYSIEYRSNIFPIQCFKLIVSRFFKAWTVQAKKNQNRVHLKSGKYLDSRQLSLAWKQFHLSGKNISFPLCTCLPHTLNLQSLGPRGETAIETEKRDRDRGQTQEVKEKKPSSHRFAPLGCSFPKSLDWQNERCNKIFKHSDFGANIWTKTEGQGRRSQGVAIEIACKWCHRGETKAGTQKTEDNKVLTRRQGKRGKKIGCKRAS